MVNKFENITDAEIDAMDKAELEAYIHYASEQEHKFDKRQHAKKILLNSLYGALGTPYFRYFNLYCAEAITLTGQATTAQSFKLFNNYLNNVLATNNDYAIASDTDSVYVNLAPLVDRLFEGSTAAKADAEIVKFLVTLCDGKFSDMLNETFDTYALKLNSMRNAIDMKREAIAKAVFVAKKNYVMMVYDDEGVRLATPKMKVTGLEAKRASTPKFFKSKLEDGYKLLFQSDEKLVHRFVDMVKEEALRLPVGTCAGVSTANNIEKWDTDGPWKSGTPKHIKGAITYNRLIKDSDLYKEIGSGEKVYIIQLKEPNPVKSPVLAYNEGFPSDLLDESYVDKELDYEKYFVTPYQRVLNVVGWNSEYAPSLDDLFV